MNAPAYLSVEQVAAIYGVSNEYVLRELRRKNLRGAKIGRTWRMTAEDVARYAEAHMNVSRVRGAAS
jgi:excisionase family DNA binding protein